MTECNDHVYKVRQYAGKQRILIEFCVDDILITNFCAPIIIYS